MFVKLLGGIDILAAVVFLSLIFGFHPALYIIMACAGLLFFKGLFVLTGDLLSVIDLVAFVVLIFSILLTMPVIVYWVVVFFLLGKGFLSFL